MPIRDIYGIRLITEEEDRERIKNLIQSAYPATQKSFSDGKPSARDYRDPEVREKNIEKSNPCMSPLYSAMHVNFVFRCEGENVFDIGEVQIMTWEEFEIYRQTREEYSNSHDLSPLDDQMRANS